MLAGQGGKYCNNYVRDKSGDGGIAGSGGTVIYSNDCKIYAYNGSMSVEVTEEKFFEYNCTLNADNKTSQTIITSNELKSIQRMDGTEIIPTEIFAQSGIARETYTTNILEDELAKVQTGETYQLSTSVEEAKSIIATYAKNIETLNYSDGFLENQGIGSGAGYLEVSNGTFEKIKIP